MVDLAKYVVGKKSFFHYLSFIAPPFKLPHELNYRRAEEGLHASSRGNKGRELSLLRC